jgi:hypothetical protein
LSGPGGVARRTEFDQAGLVAQRPYVLIKMTGSEQFQPHQLALRSDDHGNATVGVDMPAVFQLEY